MGTSSFSSVSLPQILQMIVGLGDLQERQKSRQQQEQEHKDAIALQLKQLGLQEGDKRFSQATQLMSKIAENSSAASDSIEQLASTLGLPSDVVQALKQYALTSPQTVAALRNQAAVQGYRKAPADQRAIMNQEAAFGATAGESQGQTMQSQLLAQIAGQPIQGKDWLQQLATGLQAGMAQPMAGAVQQAGLQGGMAPIAAGTQYRGDLTPAQFASIDLEGKRLQLEQVTQAQSAAERQVALQQRTGLTTSDVLSGIAKLDDIAKSLADPKMDKGSRALAIKRYNSLARMIGMDPIPDGADAPQAANMLQQYMNKYHWSPQIPQVAPDATATQIPGIPR